MWKYRYFDILYLSLINKKFPFKLIFELPLVIGNGINFQILFIKMRAPSSVHKFCWSN